MGIRQNDKISSLLLAILDFLVKRMLNGVQRLIFHLPYDL